ncbi:TCP-1/cpn60 chaperonin family protein [Desulfothermobacter acidiphilus]|uniref:TCP-1/cpn60 chaperonin family protein n=1 Tax=Desulfothermobacter acidiphilus TaxID=1938353 RepID=UPI003F8967DB
MSLKQQASSGSEVNERLAALLSNANAVRAIAAAVEGTLGPKGLDTMLVDRFGEVIITNDGVTILSTMEASHPAAKMVINVAKAQEQEVGDGTTTTTVMAGAMVSTGVELVLKGVPVARVIEGLRQGLEFALEALAAKAVPLEGLEDPRLRQVALVAGRGHRDIAELVVEAARLVGELELRRAAFKLADTVVAEEGAENQVFQGLVLNKSRLNRHMPERLERQRVLLLDDALEPEEIEEGALRTEAGFARYLALQEEFKRNLAKLLELDVGLVLTARGVADIAEELLTDAGVMVVQRVLQRDLRRVAEHTGARPIKRTGLKKSPEELARYLGEVEEVFEEEKLEKIFLRGAGKPMATIIVGAATAEVVGERERIAKDAAGAVQAAVKGGVVPGGGSVELAVAQEVEQRKSEIRGMAAYGVSCVVEALRRPLAQIVANAGFNPLEKMGDVIAAQASTGRDSLGIDCDTGEIVDMLAAGVLDPALVKQHALRAAGEIAEAILRIDTIIRKREDQAKGGEGSTDGGAG